MPPDARDGRARLRPARQAAPHRQAAAEGGAGRGLRHDRDEADAERWVKARAARDKVPLEPRRRRTLVERAGLDIVRLRGGFERLALYAMGQATITADDVRQAVSAGPEAQANFGIANAIERNDAREALRELGLAFDSGDVAVDPRTAQNRRGEAVGAAAAGGDERVASDGRRAQVVGRRPADSARAAGCGDVRPV